MKKIIAIIVIVATIGPQVTQAQYQQHDGSAETNLGLQGVGGTLFWGTMFEVDPTSSTILESIDVGFGGELSDPAVAGFEVLWQVFGADNADPSTGLTPLTAIGTHTIVNDRFVADGLYDNISVGGVDISAHDYMMIAFEFYTPLDSSSVRFPAALDEDSDNMTSWFLAGSGQFGDPSVIMFGATTSTVFPGHWIITGNTATTILLGDMNCDRTVDLLDVAPFVLALSDPVQYQADFPDCDINLGDINGDGTINLLDVGPFVDLVAGP